MRTFEALSQVILKHFNMHWARRDAMAQIIFSLIKIGSVNLAQLAIGFDSQGKTASSLRRLQRFMQQQTLSVEFIVSILFSILPLPEKITLTIDRTNWQFGKKDINFLTLAFIYNGVSIPFLWKLLDHQGNSDTKTRIALMTLALKFLDNTRILCLLADREFIGEEWFHWLSQQQIPFCIRLKANTQVKHKNGGCVPISNLCRHLNPLENLEMTTKV